jgi:transcriptional regulator with XRE-family HTH domain
MSNPATLRSLRTSRGLSQQALADKSGQHVNTILRLESKQPQMPKVDTLTAIASALGVTILDIDLGTTTPAAPEIYTIPAGPEI